MLIGMHRQIDKMNNEQSQTILICFKYNGGNHFARKSAR